MKKLLVGLCAVFASAITYAQTETTKWYIGDTVYETTTCESGGNLTMPTTPEKFGYAFQGWMPAVYDMSTLDASINTTASNCVNIGLTWYCDFSYGRIYGTSLCRNVSSTNLVHPDEDISTYDTGGYCWAIITGFAPINSDIVYEPAQPRWTFVTSHTVTQCEKNCGLWTIQQKVNIDATARRNLFAQ